MEIRQLKYFAAVADTLNFSRAAETLFISQSALSKQIADLERELGMVLLQIEHGCIYGDERRCE